MRLHTCADAFPTSRAYLAFETPKTRGQGLLRLKQDNGQYSQAFTFFTVRPKFSGSHLLDPRLTYFPPNSQTLWEIKGHEEFAYERRPNGADIHEQPGPEAKNWLQLRAETVKFEKKDPTVLIIGGTDTKNT